MERCTFVLCILRRGPHRLYRGARWKSERSFDHHQACLSASIGAQGELGVRKLQFENFVAGTRVCGQTGRLVGENTVSHADQCEANPPRRSFASAPPAHQWTLRTTHGKLRRPNLGSINPPVLTFKLLSSPPSQEVPLVRPDWLHEEAWQAHLRRQAAGQSCSAWQPPAPQVLQHLHPAIAAHWHSGKGLHAQGRIVYDRERASAHL
jgi:hypothetical protein